MKCLNTRAKLIIQQLYEAMFHEPYMLTEGSHAKINNNLAFMPVVIEKVGRLPGYGEVISIAHYGEQSGDLMADPEMEFTIIGGDYYPISFRNDYLGKHSSVFENDGINLPLQYDLTTFANQWMRKNFYFINIMIGLYSFTNLTQSMPKNYHRQLKRFFHERHCQKKFF